MKKIQFGINDRKITTGADLYTLIFQISSLLPLPFMLMITGYPAVIGSDNVLTFLAGIGFMAIPRAETLLLSLAYRLLSSELTVYFALLIPAFVLGIVFRKILKGSEHGSRLFRKVLIVLIACDLVLRVLPFSFNLSFGLAAAIIGFVLRAACLVLIILDLQAH